jgi:hypothetical protein
LKIINITKREIVAPIMPSVRPAKFRQRFCFKLVSQQIVVRSFSIID